MTTSTTMPTLDLRHAELRQHLATMYQSMRFVLSEAQQINAPPDVRERVVTLAERFCFVVANVAHELDRLPEDCRDATHRMFIELRQIILVMHEVVLDVRDQHPDSLVSSLLLAHGMDILHAYHAAKQLIAKIGGWYHILYESRDGASIGDPRIAACIV